MNTKPQKPNVCVCLEFLCMMWKLPSFCLNKFCVLCMLETGAGVFTQCGLNCLIC